MKPEAYTAEELRQMLKDRQSGMTLQDYASEIGISMQYLSQILNGHRSPGNEEVLRYLAPPGKEFAHRDQWILVKKTT